MGGFKFSEIVCWLRTLLKVKTNFQNFQHNSWYLEIFFAAYALAAAIETENILFFVCFPVYIYLICPFSLPISILYYGAIDNKSLKRVQIAWYQFKKHLFEMSDFVAEFFLYFFWSLYFIRVHKYCKSGFFPS